MESLSKALEKEKSMSFLTHTVQMESVKNLTKIKIAKTLFNSQVVKHYTKLLKNLQVDIFSANLDIQKIYYCILSFDFSS
jgi:hypothetical protein